MSRICDTCNNTGKIIRHNWARGGTEERECYSCREGPDAETKALEDELVRVRERFGKVLVAIDDAWANYERMGEVCPFEGQPMIYAATLEEIHNVAIDAALSPTTTNKKES